MCVRRNDESNPTSFDLHVARQVTERATRQSRAHGLLLCLAVTGAIISAWDLQLLFTWASA
jgi:hypothetical protein